MLNCQCQLPTKLAVAKTPILIGSANCQQNWQLLKRQLPLAVETANRNWRQFWSQPRLQLALPIEIGVLATANFVGSWHWQLSIGSWQLAVVHWQLAVEHWQFALGNYHQKGGDC